MPTATAETTLARPAAALAKAGWTARLWRPVPSSSTTAFRIAFGLLAAFSSARLIWKGWVGEFYLAPTDHLTYPRFEWVRPLPGALMYAHVIVLGLLGLAIAAGWKTRSCAVIFAAGFGYLELIDAALYLNHYWFVTLAAVLLAIVPQPSRERTVPVITVWALRIQVAVVYVFAGLAKLNTDWLVHAQPLRIWLAARTDRPLVGPWLDEPLAAFAMSWAGAAFDLTIVAWLLWPRTRRYAYLAVIGFHVATAALFQIGLFPWVMIALTPIFFSPSWAGRGEAGHALRDRSAVPIARKMTTAALSVLLLVNLGLPLRHLVAPGDVAVNDDGYYLAWRVMVTERVAAVRFEITDPVSGASWSVRPEDVLADWQVSQVTSRPDLILATAHIVAARYDDPVEVRADVWVSINGHPRQRWIDPTIDLAALPRTTPTHEYVL
jgi:vitamin K-dependent gamma-carboxylase